MRKIILILLIFTSHGHAINREEGMTDLEIKEMMIGSWVKSPNDPTYREYGQISNYKANGDLSFEGYETHLCDNIMFRTKAKWEIKNGNLIIIVKSSERPDIHPPGLVVVDKVVNINQKYKTLKNIDDENLQYRFKSNDCYKENEI